MLLPRLLAYFSLDVLSLSEWAWLVCVCVCICFLGGWGYVRVFALFLFFVCLFVCCWLLFFIVFCCCCCFLGGNNLKYIIFMSRLVFCPVHNAAKGISPQGQLSSIILYCIV